MRGFLRPILWVSFGSWLGCGAATTATTAGSSDGNPPAAPSTAVSVVPSDHEVASPRPSATAAAPAGVSATSATVAAPPLPKATAVLHVGDSFVHSGLTQRLRTHFEAQGVRYEVHAEVSTNSLDWAKRVPGLVSATQPDLVLVTLGGNEIGSTHLDVQAKAAKRIVAAIGGRPCVWMTPPLWREELGLFDAVTASIAPCRLFETDVEVKSFIPRREDKIHPTPEGGARWADALHGWLMRERVGTPKPWTLADGPASDAAPKGHRFPLPPAP